MGLANPKSVPDKHDDRDYDQSIPHQHTVSLAKLTLGGGVQIHDSHHMLWGASTQVTDVQIGKASLEHYASKAGQLHEAVRILMER